MQIYDVIGAAIVLALLIYWLVFRSDPRVPVVVALALLLLVVGFTMIGESETADVLGNLFFYTLVLGVAEITIESYLERKAKRKGVPRTEHPFFGEVPERMKRRS